MWGQNQESSGLCQEEFCLSSDEKFRANTVMV